MRRVGTFLRLMDGHLLWFCKQWVFMALLVPRCDPASLERLKRFPLIELKWFSFDVVVGGIFVRLHVV